MLTQVTVTFALVCILWWFTVTRWRLVRATTSSATLTADAEKHRTDGGDGQHLSVYYVAFQGSFACITVGLIVGALRNESASQLC